MAEGRKKKAKSPYQKYGKTPIRYSELYRAWNQAVKSGRRDEADRLGRQHTARFAAGPVVSFDREAA